MIKAIIFDYDGVLVHSLPIGVEAWKEIARKFNVEGFARLEDFQAAQLNGFVNILDSSDIADKDLAKQIYFQVNDKFREKITHR